MSIRQETRTKQHTIKRLRALEAKYGTMYRVAQILGINSGLICRVMRGEWSLTVNQAVFYHDWGPAIQFLQEREK